MANHSDRLKPVPSGGLGHTVANTDMSQIQIIKRTPMPHLSIKNSDASNRLNDYIFSCTKSGYPSVVCKRYTKYADVDVMFDLSDSFSLSPYEARSKEILNAVSTIVEKHTSLRGGDNISLFDVHIG